MKGAGLHDACAYFKDLKRYRAADRRPENACRRVPSALQDPLNKVAAAVAGLWTITVPSGTEVMHAYTETLTSTPRCDPAREFRPTAIGEMAVTQYKAAVDLHEAIGPAWRVIDTERGSGP